MSYKPMRRCCSGWERMPVCQGRVFVAAESKNGLVHVDGIENAQAYQQLEVVYAQAGDFFEKSRIELGDDILQRVFPEIGQVHEGRDAGGELDQLFLDLLALGLVVLLLLAELPLLLGSEGLAFFLLALRDGLALIDHGLEDVRAKRTEALNIHDRLHDLSVLHDAFEGLVVHVHQDRGLPLLGQQGCGGTGHGDIQDFADVDFLHVGPVVGQHGQEAHQLGDRRFWALSFWVEPSPIVSHLPQRPRGSKVEDETGGFEDLSLTGDIPVRVLNRLR